MNSLAVLAVAELVGADLALAALALAELKAIAGRGAPIELDLPGGAALLIDESYNANPTSVDAALALLGQAPIGPQGRRIAVLGDMLELGEKELDFHAETGRAIPKAVDVVVGVGRRSKSLLDGAREAGFDHQSLHHFDDAESAGKFLKSFMRPGDLVLIKASRGIGLDKVVTMLSGAPPSPAASTGKDAGAPRNGGRP